MVELPIRLVKVAKMLGFSVVMPIHNEEEVLPKTLPSVFKLKPNDVVLIFDRCTDRSLSISREIAKRFNYNSKTRFLEMNEPSPEWRFRPAFLRTYGYDQAKNKIILNTDADIILDERIREYIKLVGENDICMISFSRKEYPFTFQSFIARLVSTFIPKIAFTGTYAFLKEIWQESTRKEKMRKIISAEDTYIYMLISEKCKTRFIKTNNIHLRPRENSQRHFTKGIARWEITHDPLWKVLIHSIVYLHPMVLVGYLYAKSSRE